MTLFDTLKDLFTPVAASLSVSLDDRGHYSLNTKQTRNGKPVYFGGVRKGKRYTSLYLMPAYFYKDFLNDASPDLLKRLHGKACFNFNAIERHVLKELGEYVKTGLKRMESDGLA